MNSSQLVTETNITDDNMKIICLGTVLSKESKRVNEDSFYCDSKLAILVNGASSRVELGKNLLYVTC